MPRTPPDPDLFVPLIVRLQDDLRKLAHAVVADLISAEVERRTSILSSVEQAFDAVLAKPPPASRTPTERQVPRKITPRSKATAVRGGEGSAQPTDAASAPERGVEAGLPTVAMTTRLATSEPSQHAGLEPSSAMMRAAPSALDDPKRAAPSAPDVATATLARAADRVARARARRAAAEGSEEPNDETADRTPRPNADSVDNFRATDAISNEAPRATGIVKRFDAVRGFGFILAPDGGEDYFVHIKDVVANGTVLLEGTSVSYVARQGQRGRFAVDVRPIVSVR